MTASAPHAVVHPPSPLAPLGRPAATLVEYLPRLDDVPTEPYRGINPFRVADEHLFFGRDEEVLTLLRLVSIYRGVLLYGDSGAGKSSLVNAGFIPAAIRNGYWPERLRVRREPTPAFQVERIVCSPSGAERFLPSKLLTEQEAAARDVTLSPRELLRRVRGVQGARPLLIFDQFEEAVTLFEEPPRAGAAASASDSPEELYAVLRALLTGETEASEEEGNDAGGQRALAAPVKVLFSFREDYLAKLSTFFDTVHGLTDHALRITPPGLDCLELIVVGPLDRFEGRLRRNGAVASLPASVTSRVVADFRTRVGAGRMVPTEVQIVCQELWRSANPEATLKQGLKGLLERFLDGAIESYPRAEERDAAVALLSHMVTDAGTRNIVSETDLLAQVQKETGVAKARLQAILRDFDGHKTRLVRREEPRDVAFYTIASEFLVSRIRDWRVQRAEARRTAKLWRRWMIGLGVAVLVALLLGTQYAAQQRARIGELVVRAQNDSLTLAVAANRAALAEGARHIDLLRDSARALAAVADSQSRTARTAGELRTALDAESRARQQSEAVLKQALAAADSLRRLASLNASNVAALTSERDGLRRQLAAAGGRDAQSSLADSLRYDVRRLTAERDQLRDSRERWLPVVLRARRSSDDEERDFANAVCRADPWNCASLVPSARAAAP